MSTEPEIKAKIGGEKIETSVAYGPLQITYERGGMVRQIFGIIFLLLGLAGVIISSQIPREDAVFVAVLSIILLLIALFLLGLKPKEKPAYVPMRMIFPRHDIIQTTNWYRPKNLTINASETLKFTLKSCEFTFLHAFHVSLRQTLEDLGYVIAINLSPVEGAIKTNYSTRYALRSGIHGYKYKNREIEFWILKEGEITAERATGVLTITIGFRAKSDEYLEEANHDFQKIIEQIKRTLEEYRFKEEDL